MTIHGPDTDATGRRSGPGESGFALLVSLIAIVGLTALATGGYFLANSERRTASNHKATVEAFYLAEAGLRDYLGSQGGVPPTGPTVVATPQYPDAGGSARVEVQLIDDQDPDAPLYLVSSQGRYDPNGTGDPVTRTVRTVSVLNKTSVPDPDASIKSGGGISKQGASGEINGADQCGSAADVAGVHVPPDGYDQSGNGDVVFGDPPVKESTSPLEPWTEEMWTGMTDGSRLSYDHEIRSSSDEWPDFSSTSDMPVTLVDQENYSLGSEESGQGLLIVSGNLTLKGGFEWDGVILVGGSLTDNGIGRVEGAVTTGLNTLKGENVNQDDLADTDDDDLNGTKKFLFHSCFIQQIQNSTAFLAELPGVWHEAM